MNEPNDYSSQVQQLRPSPGDLLVIYPKTAMTREQHQLTVQTLKPLAERLGCTILVSQPDIEVAIQPGSAALLAEMQKQTAILEAMAEQQAILLQELAGDERDDDRQPLAYMDGSPIKGRT